MLIINKRNIAIFAAVFTMTLKSMYISRLGFSFDNFVVLILVPVVGLSLLDKEMKLDVPVFVVLSYVVIYSLYTLFVTIESAQPAKYIFSMPALVVYSVLITMFVKFHVEKYGVLILLKSVNLAILIHAIFLLLQIVFAVYFGEIYDFVHAFSGFETSHKLMGGYLFNTYGLDYLFRPSGLFNEPGTYSSFMALLVAVSLYLNNYQYDFYSVIGTLSILMTFSAQGAIYAALLIILMLGSVKSHVIKIIFIVPSFLLVTNTLYYLVVVRMTEGLDDSLDNRINSMAVFGDFIGDGYVSTDVNMTDIGTLPYLFAIGGIVSIPLFVSMFYLIISKFNVRKILLVLFIFTSKIVPANPFFWFYIAVIYYYDAGRPR